MIDKIIDYIEFGIDNLDSAWKRAIRNKVSDVVTNNLTLHINRSENDVLKNYWANTKNLNILKNYKHFKIIFKDNKYKTNI